MQKEECRRQDGALMYSGINPLNIEGRTVANDSDVALVQKRGIRLQSLGGKPIAGSLERIGRCQTLSKILAM